MSCASTSRSLMEIEEGEPLRFQVGDSVVCKTCRTTWEDGEIVQLWWRHPEKHVFHPYQVKLRTDERLIYVPVDDDDVIRKIESVWWETLKDCWDDLSDNEVVNLIGKLSTGKNLDAQSWDGETALLWALKCDWQAAVHALLGLKVDPNCAGTNCDRAINVAVSRFSGSAQADLTKALLEAKANPRLQDKDPDKDPDFNSTSFQEREWHRTALHYAAEQGHVGIMRLLVDARAELNMQDAQYKMPLHLAIESKKLDAVRLLIDSQADINTGHIEIGLATSPLIDAAYRDDQALMRLLIDAKANLNHRGKQDMTALHVAARGRHTGAVRILAAAGADTTLMAGGKSSGEIALKNGLSEMATLLGYMGERKKGEAASQVLGARTRAILSSLVESNAKIRRTS
mmetsp:Transcript_7579/g.14042  ORF Transcript_7579/g.14042 Transcript_7579/m.14042 type:complete len:400 (+) Transcript_7579:61-1260(+)